MRCFVYARVTLSNLVDVRLIFRAGQFSINKSSPRIHSLLAYARRLMWSVQVASNCSLAVTLQSPGSTCSDALW